jgi:hypothetical protein
MLTLIQSTSFPPIPEDMGMDSMTLNYELRTQKGITLKDLFVDKVINFGATSLKGFCI